MPIYSPTHLTLFLILLFLSIFHFQSNSQQNVGIRTVQPDAALHVYSGGQVPTPGGLLLMGDRTYVHFEFDVNSLQVRSGLTSYPTLKLQDLGGDLNIGNGRLYIDNDGAAIGAHTSSPDAPFHIMSGGEVNTTGGLLLLGNRSIGHLEMDFNLLQSRNGLANFSTFFIQQFGGNLNIGDGLFFADRIGSKIGINNITPDYTLDVNGNAGINQYLHHNGDSNTYLNFTANRVRFTTGGKTLLSVINSFSDEVKLGDGSDVDINLNDELYVTGSNDYVGINTPDPTSRLNIDATAGESVLEAEVSSSTIFEVHNNGGVSIGNGNAPPASGLYISGDVGIGTTTPNTKLHLIGGSNATLGSGGYLAIGHIDGVNLVIDNNEILARNNGNAGDLYIQQEGGRVGIGTAPTSKLHIDSDAGQNALIAQVDGDYKFVVESTGDVGLGLSNPSSGLHLRHGTSNGLKIQVSTTSDFWRIDTDAVNGNLNLYAINTFRGSFDAGNGNYNPGSDRRIKKSLESMDDVLPIIKLLKPLKYRFIDQSDTHQKSIGFIAQDVLDVFPTLVSYNSDAGLYCLNYSGFSVLAIKAIQEQQTVLELLQEENEQIKKELNEIKEILLQKFEIQSGDENE